MPLLLIAPPPVVVSVPPVIVLPFEVDDRAGAGRHGIEAAGRC